MTWVVCDRELMQIGGDYAENGQALKAAHRLPFPAMVLNKEAWQRRVQQQHVDLAVEFLRDGIAEVGRVLAKEGGMLSQRWRGLSTEELKDKAIAHLKVALQTAKEPNATHGAVRALMLVKRLAEDRR